jgi:two-component system chemotaxis sensor kinase CheA
LKVLTQSWKKMVKERTEELETKNFELQQMNKKLEEINRLKSAFLANRSHELRTPLNSILSLSEGLIRKIPGELNRDQEEYLKIIFKNGKDLLDLINDLLDLAKIEAGKMKLNHRIFVVNRLIEEVVEIIYPMTQEKGLHFFVEVDRSMPPVIYSDEEKIKRIILNLASNAVKFTKEGLVVLGVKRYLPKNAQRSYIQFSVSDTGIGISKEHQEAIFGEFIQLDASRARRYQGAGLGLAISKKLVQILEGEIWLNSKPGEGSTFMFTVPTYEDQISPEALAYMLEGEKNVEVRFRKFELKPKTEQGPKVLLITDVLSTQYTIKFLLATRDIQVIIPDPGQKEFYKNLEIRPDLILVDVSTPTWDGLTILKNFREIQTYQGIPILAITPGPKEEQESKWIKMGYNDYITKPIYKSDLLDKVSYWLNPTSC